AMTACSAVLVFLAVKIQSAAITAISIAYFGAASLVSIVVRQGGLAGSIQASHTAFSSAKVPISTMKTLADSSLLLSVPASASSASIWPRISLVWSVTEPPAVALA